MHHFAVRAIANVADPSPAEKDFQVGGGGDVAPYCSPLCPEIKNYLDNFTRAFNVLTILVAITLAIVVAILILTLRKRR